jgi:hypothetical protein
MIASTRTVLAYPAVARIGIRLGLPVLAVLFGAALPFAARWVLAHWHGGLPLRPAFVVAGAVDRPWQVAVNLAVWGVVGAVLADRVLADEVRLVVSDGEVRAGPGAGEPVAARDDVAAVFADGPVTVVLDGAGRQRLRDRVQVPRAEVAAAFEAHGYPWCDADPHADRYRSWSPGDGAVPPVVETLLEERRRVLGRDVARARRLREAIEDLGYAVREDGTRQQWRPLTTPGGPSPR